MAPLQSGESLVGEDHDAGGWDGLSQSVDEGKVGAGSHEDLTKDCQDFAVV